MTAPEFAVHVLVIGLVAFDPLGAVVAAAALASGAGRRGLTALTAGYLAAQVALGVAATAAVRVLAGTGWVREALDTAHRHRLGSWAELLVGVGLAAWAVTAMLRARRREGAGGEAKPDAPVWTRRLGSTPALAGAGGVVALYMLGDPGFAALAVDAHRTPWTWWVPAWLLWSTTSAVLLVALWLAVVADRDGRLTARAEALTSRVLARSGPWLRAVVALVGVALAVDGVRRLLG